jgi:hypothetical protein
MNVSDQRRGRPSEKDLRSRSCQQRRLARQKYLCVYGRTQEQQDLLRRRCDSVPHRTGGQTVLMLGRLDGWLGAAATKACGHSGTDRTKDVCRASRDRLRPAPCQDQCLKRQHLRQHQTQQQPARGISISHPAAMPCRDWNVHDSRDRRVPKGRRTCLSALPSLNKMNYYSTLGPFGTIFT